MKKTTEELLREREEQAKAIRKDVARLKKKMLDEQREREFKAYENLYKAMSHTLKAKNVTVDYLSTHTIEEIQSLIYTKNN